MKKGVGRLSACRREWGVMGVIARCAACFTALGTAAPIGDSAPMEKAILTQRACLCYTKKTSRASAPTPHVPAERVRVR